MQTEKEASIQNRSSSSLKVLHEHYGADFFLYEYPENRKSQTFHCPSGFLIYWGGMALLEQRDVVGVLRPELLGEKERLQLSQNPSIWGAGFMDIPQNILDTVFCRMDAMRQGIMLANPEEVWSYVMMQKDYQYRILICDRDDFAVLEMLEEG